MNAGEMKDVEYGLTGYDRNAFSHLYYWKHKYGFIITLKKQ